MLDNLRNQASFEPEEDQPPEGLPPAPKPPKPRRSFNKMTGTTGMQRLVLSIMLLTMVCLLGVMALVITGKIMLPFG